MEKSPCGGRAGMVHFLFGNESEERNRASFPRWGKLRVISNHFPELVLEIMGIEMLTLNKERW